MRASSFLVLVLATTNTRAQQPRRDPRAIAVLVQMVSATGWAGVVQLGDAEATGTVTAATAGSNPAPIVIKARPGNQLRIEFPATDTTVVRNGQTGKLVVGAQSNALPWHSLHAMSPAAFPFFSTAGDFNLTDVSIVYLGTEQVNGEAAYMIDLQHVADAGDSLGALRQKGTHIVVSVSTTTYFPVKMQFTLNSVTDPNASLPVTRYWSNYQSVQGIYVPFLAQDFVAGNLFLTVRLDSVRWNVGLLDSDFDTQ